MFTAGPSTTPTPNARASRPMAAPSRRARSGSKLAATEHPVGKQTALRLWLGSSCSGSWVRRPCGPSETIRVGMPRRSTVLVCQKSAPEQSPAFSSSVSWATSSGMLCSIKKSSSFCPPAAGGGQGQVAVVRAVETCRIHRSAHAASGVCQNGHTPPYFVSLYTTLHAKR